jgi:ribosome biogenesis GTPase
VVSIAESKGCDSIICLNKSDLDRADELMEIYQKAGFRVLRISAETGEGIEELSKLIAGKISAFTGNSGVGKSSILNALEPDFGLPTGEVSQKLGRGRHTTRHVELFRLKNGAIVADTPGFSSFDVEEDDQVGRKETLASTFREFEPYVKDCYFTGCSHRKEKGCSLLEALRRGDISPSRHASYLRLYEQAEKIKDWERPK